MRYLRTKLGHVAFSLAFIWLVSEAPVSAQAGALPPTDPRAQTLQALGEAYAKDVGLTLLRTEMVLAGAVDDPVTWTKRLEDALVVGYSPASGTFHAIPFSKVKSIVRVKAAEGRSPEDVVKRVVTRGASVIETSWYFGGATPVKSYAVFSPDGLPLFDTMILMPALRGPVFSVGHEP